MDISIIINKYTTIIINKYNNNIIAAGVVIIV